MVAKSFLYESAFEGAFNPLTPMSDQDRISPYNTTSSRHVMRIKKNIDQGDY